MSPHAIRTRAVHAGRDDLVDLGVHAVPIDLSTTYPSRDSAAEARRLERLETALAELESCEASVAFASGMAALTACLLATVAAGKPHVVAIRPLYGTSDFLLDSGLLGVTVTWARPEQVTDSIRPDTGLVIVETPANPTLDEIDIRTLVDSAAPVPVLVDNTFATPALQRPAELGAQVVLHSATKFLGGHGDVMGGVVACTETYARTLRQIRFVTGAVLHPLAGYLLLRAGRLVQHSAVRKVHYPGLNDERPAGQMATGGALVSFEISGDPHTVIGAVEVFAPAVSLGSVDSLIQHPGSLSHHILDPEKREAIGISDSFLRLSIGLEDADDLWNDLDQALGSPATMRPR